MLPSRPVWHRERRRENAMGWERAMVRSLAFGLFIMKAIRKFKYVLTVVCLSLVCFSKA